MRACASMHPYSLDEEDEEEEEECGGEEMLSFLCLRIVQIQSSEKERCREEEVQKKGEK